jgi:hypothetical protein
MARPLPTYAEALLQSLLRSAELTTETDSDRTSMSSIRAHYLSELIHHLIQMLVSRGYDVGALVAALDENAQRWRPLADDTPPKPTGLRRFLKR